MSSLHLLRPAASAARSVSRSANTARYFHSTGARRVVHEVKTAEEFKSTIAKEPKVLVDCFAEWCGPCKAIAPILSKASDDAEFKDKVHFVKFDVDELPELSRELGVRAMPTFLFFDGGKKVNELVGANPPVLLTSLRQLLE